MYPNNYLNMQPIQQPIQQQQQYTQQQNMQFPQQFQTPQNIQQFIPPLSDMQQFQQQYQPYQYINNNLMYINNNQYQPQTCHLFTYLIANNISSFNCKLWFVDYYCNPYNVIIFSIYDIYDVQKDISITPTLSVETKIGININNCSDYNMLYSNIVSGVITCFKAHIEIDNKNINNFSVKILN